MISNDPTIRRIHAREVLDSRGNPTVEVEVHCAGGAVGRAIVPSGASTGRHEAVELRDGDPSRYGGKGVRRAVANVRDILAPRLHGMDASEQARIDHLLCELDGTANKSRLGANALLGVSLACAHAAAASRGQPLWRYLDTEGVARMPLPMVNLISGGLHAGGNLDLQDFLFMPIGARSYSEALEMTVAVYRALGRVLIRHGFEGVLVGDEGGYGPRLQSNEQAIEMILRAFEDAELKPGEQAALALDVASTHFYRDDRYHLRIDGGRALDADGMLALLERWVKQYPIRSIEDGLAEDDWDGWQKLTAALGERVQLIGDDLFVTNPERLRRGIAEGVANCVLVKVNQIGTLTEALDVVRLAREAGYRAVISARSGETEDSTLADLAVASGAGQIKIGSVARSERLAKYNQLLRIEEEMSSFAGNPKSESRKPKAERNLNE
ncbi:MAG TPA: phosphopyruvate hydratase [Gemmataceae bacterium]|nr:phosphopyruvate hydratase [Gemmataceae bacterium]